jgi:hemerythrin-like metal-binding protein
LIASQKKDMVDSISYASLIQQAILPDIKILEQNTPDHFILYKPRDIVSGDFYWCKQIRNYLYIAAADCTGHGVPGAFMSMLGISLLNEIVDDQTIPSPDQILNQLRNLIIQSLHQTFELQKIHDGMDIAMCMIDLENYTLQFAGAYNPLYLIRSQTGNNFQPELIVIKADRMPIGIHIKEEHKFTNHEIKLQPGDTCYIFSDGFTSQFGGETGETFKSSRLQQTLLNIQKRSMPEQKVILEQLLVTWLGKWEQNDDILVIGLRFNELLNKETGLKHILIKWDNQLFSVDVALIDDQHQKLINILNQFYNSYNQQNQKQNLQDLLDELLDYSVYHFHTEEKYFRDSDEPQVKSHLNQHNFFIRKVNDFRIAFNNDETKLTIELIYFLKDWLINHIQGTDMKFKHFFQSELNEL